MPTIYSTKFAAGSQTAGTSSAVFTVPVGKIAVVRSISLAPQAGPTTQCAVNDFGNGEIFTVHGGNQYDTLTWTGRAVMNAGDVIQIDAIAGTWSYHVSGYLLDA